MLGRLNLMQFYIMCSYRAPVRKLIMYPYRPEILCPLNNTSNHVMRIIVKIVLKLSQNIIVEIKN